MKKTPKKNPFKYYIVGTQVAATILLAIFIGYQIDKYFNNVYYGVTISLSLVAIFYVLYALVRKINKEK
jgi:F0F1-type ATP synthase assembly protein I